MRDIIKKTDNGLLDLGKRRVCIRIIRPIKIAAIGLVAFVFLFNLTVLAPGSSSPSFSAIFAAESVRENVSANDEAGVLSPAEERRRLEEQLAELERKMAEQRRIIEEARAKGRTLQSEIDRLDAEIRQIGFQIEAVSLTLQKLAQEIVETEESIGDTEQKIEAHKDALAKSLRNIYEAENQSLLVALLQNSQISEIVNSINNILMVQDSVKSSLEAIVGLKTQLVEQKDDLQYERGEVISLRNLQQAQRGRLEETQSERAHLLEQTQNQESLYQELLEETRKTAEEVRAQIFRFVGGGELDFETAYQLARLAEGRTGIRAALILAILDKESNLGRNVGQCRLVDLVSGSSAGINTGRVFPSGIHPTRDIPPFIKITETIGLEPLQTLLSCPLDIGYGGAMGPAQFIPSTWAIFGGYQNINGQWTYNPQNDRIGAITGNRPSNPWNNQDAVVATSLYIMDLYNDSVCSNYANSLRGQYPERELREECAAARYYAGGNWRSPANYWGYGVDVRKRADQYQRDIDILERNN